MKNVHVVEAHALQTGGNVYTYWGKLSDGNHFVFSDDIFLILDTDYGTTFTKKFFDATDGDTYEWEKEHTLRTIETRYMWHFVEEAKKLICS